MAKKRKRKVRVAGKEVSVQEEPGGTGFTMIINGDTEKEVWRIVTAIQAFSLENRMEQIEVMSVQPSPAGGWEAIVRAHNFNILKTIGGSVKSVGKAAKGLGEATSEAAKRKAKEKVKGYTEQEEKAAYEALGWTEPAPGVIPTETREEYVSRIGKTKEDVRAEAQRIRRERETERDIKRYGIEVETPGRLVEYTETVDGKERKYGTRYGGKKLSPEEVRRRIAKAKKEAPPSFTKQLAGSVRKYGKEGMEWGTGVSVSIGQTAGQPFGPSAFRRGAQTFGPTGVPPNIAAFTPGAQKRLMAATTMPGIAPIGGLRIGNRNPLQANVSVLAPAVPSPLPATVTRGRRGRVPSVVPGQDSVEIF